MIQHIKYINVKIYVQKNPCVLDFIATYYGCAQISRDGCSLVYKCIQRRKNSCKQKLWKLRSGKFQGTRVGNFVCNAMPDEIREMLNSNFGTIFGFQLCTRSLQPTPCSLHPASSSQNFWSASRHMSNKTRPPPELRRNLQLPSPTSRPAEREGILFWLLSALTMQQQEEEEIRLANLCHSPTSAHIWYLSQPSIIADAEKSSWLRKIFGPETLDDI